MRGKEISRRGKNSGIAFAASSSNNKNHTATKRLNDSIIQQNERSIRHICDFDFIMKITEIKLPIVFKSF